MMEKEMRDLIIAALSACRGDNLERARMAFKGCTEAQMDQVWSGNGETRREVLQVYERYAARVDGAVAAIKAL